MIGGTSASSPAFTGFVALLNDALLSQGLSPLGFLNPLIYSIPEAFNDITIGHNSGCGTTGFNVSTWLTFAVLSSLLIGTISSGYRGMGSW